MINPSALIRYWIINIRVTIRRVSNYLAIPSWHILQHSFQLSNAKWSTRKRRSIEQCIENFKFRSTQSSGMIKLGRKAFIGCFPPLFTCAIVFRQHKMMGDQLNDKRMSEKDLRWMTIKTSSRKCLMSFRNEGFFLFVAKFNQFILSFCTHCGAVLLCTLKARISCRMNDIKNYNNGSHSGWP